MDKSTLVRSSDKDKPNQNGAFSLIDEDSGTAENPNNRHNNNTICSSGDICSLPRKPPNFIVILDALVIAGNSLQISLKIN